MSVAHRFGEPFLLPSLRTHYQALHLGNTANLGNFFDTAKRFFTLYNVLSHFFLYSSFIVSQRTNLN